MGRFYIMKISIYHKIISTKAYNRYNQMYDNFQIKQHDQSNQSYNFR